MSQNNIPVEYLIARYFIKYQQLDNLIPNAFKGSKANAVNIYIDLYGLYKTIFSRNYRTDISDYTAFTVTLINMCSHYRSYFKGMGVYAHIFLISSYNVPEISKRFVANYNKTFCDKLKNTAVKEMVELNTELLNILCPYLPNIYFLSTKFESTVLINKLIQLESKKNNLPNIIISSDIYPMQLCSEYDNTVFLKPIKFQGVDNSVITYPRGHELHEISFWSVICRERDKLVSDASEVTISPRNFMLLMALNRFPERNFENLLQQRVANRYISNVIGNQPIKLSLDMLYQSQPELLTKIPQSKIDARYKTLDVEYQSLLFEEDLESKVLHYENLNDPTAVQMINSQYFEKNPIDLFRL